MSPVASPRRRRLRKHGAVSWLLPAGGRALSRPASGWEPAVLRRDLRAFEHRSRTTGERTEPVVRTRSICPDDRWLALRGVAAAGD